MLLNLNKVNWGQALKNRDFKEQKTDTERMLKDMAKLTGEYNKWIQEENKKTKEEFIVSSVGKMNPKNHLSHGIDDALTENVMECLGTMINTVVF
jgi:26S proteasome regulatory subunit N11